MPPWIGWIVIPQGKRVINRTQTDTTRPPNTIHSFTRLNTALIDQNKRNGTNIANFDAGKIKTLGPRPFPPPLVTLLWVTKISWRAIPKKGNGFCSKEREECCSFLLDFLYWWQFWSWIGSSTTQYMLPRDHNRLMSKWKPLSILGLASHVSRKWWV